MTIKIFYNARKSFVKGYEAARRVYEENRSGDLLDLDFGDYFDLGKRVYETFNIKKIKNKNLHNQQQHPLFQEKYLRNSDK